MTIKVYPSRLEGEPLETHATTEVMSIAAWCERNIPGFDIEALDRHPTATLNGEHVPVSEWALTFFRPDDDVRFFVEAKGLGAGAIALIAAAVSAVVVAVMMTRSQPTGGSSRARGTTIEDPGQLANLRRYGEPIPEVAGSPIVYPDYVLPPRRYYQSRTQQWVEQLLCIGKGQFQKSIANVFVGDTSALSMGDDIEVRFFEPGEIIDDPAAVWWHTPEEVGFTSFGGAGMTLGAAGSVPPYWADSFVIVGASITGSRPVPSGWEVGMFVRVEAEHPITFGPDWISSELLDTLEIGIGEDIEITGERAGVYTVSSVAPGIPASSGSPAVAAPTSQPSRRDFDVTPIYIQINIGGSTYSISLNTAAPDDSALLADLNSQLNGSPVRFRIVPNGFELYQIHPYDGGVLVLSGDVGVLMGTPMYTQGVAARSASGVRYYLSGAEFAPGEEMAAAGRDGLLYQIASITGSNIIVTPIEVPFWVGFPESTASATSNAILSTGSTEGGWIGPFAACPAGESADAFEVDVFLPQGLIRYNKKGRIRSQDAGGTIQWRYIGDNSWNSQTYNNELATADQIGFTYRVEHDPGRVEVRMRARRPPSTDSSVSNMQQWSGLRSRIIGAPVSYPGITTMAVRIRSGDKVSGGVENKISVRPVRILPTVENPDVMEPTRDLAPFLIYMMGTVGYGRNLLDMDHIAALHEIWREREDYFDLSITSASTIKTVGNHLLAAGFAELTVRRGLITPVRDAHRIGTPTRVYSPQEYRTQLVEVTETVQPDDVDGVDVEYVDYRTGRTLTESFRLPGDEGLRVETIKVPGITRRTQAWRQAARRRRILAFRRTLYRGGTEMAALNSDYMDFVGLQDGIPEYGQSAFVLSASGRNLVLSEVIHRYGPEANYAMLRRADGTSTGLIRIVAHDGRNITLEQDPGFPVQGGEYPTVVYIGQQSQVVHNALMVEVSPNGDGTVDFEAVRMDNRVYLDDDMGPDVVILTSKLYPVMAPHDDIQTSATVGAIQKRSVYQVAEAADEIQTGAAVSRITLAGIMREYDYSDEIQTGAMVSSIALESAMESVEPHDDIQTVAIVESIVKMEVVKIHNAADDVESSAVVATITKEIQ